MASLAGPLAWIEPTLRRSPSPASESDHDVSAAGGKDSDRDGVTVTRLACRRGSAGQGATASGTHGPDDPSRPVGSRWRMSRL
jgi:hypothetical protein